MLSNDFLLWGLPEGIIHRPTPNLPNNYVWCTTLTARPQLTLSTPVESAVMMECCPTQSLAGCSGRTQTRDARSLPPPLWSSTSNFCPVWRGIERNCRTEIHTTVTSCTKQLQLAPPTFPVFGLQFPRFFVSQIETGRNGWRLLNHQAIVTNSLQHPKLQLSHCQKL